MRPNFAIGPAPHRVSRALRARNPGRVRKESGGKNTPGQSPKCAERVAPESQKRPKRVRTSGFRLFSDSFETPGRTLAALLGPCSGVLFPDFFWTFPGFRARRTLWEAGPIATLMSTLSVTDIFRTLCDLPSCSGLCV